jgi:hypothetical protein
MGPIGGIATLAAALLLAFVAANETDKLTRRMLGWQGWHDDLASFSVGVSILIAGAIICSRSVRLFARCPCCAKRLPRGARRCGHCAGGHTFWDCQFCKARTAASDTDPRCANCGAPLHTKEQGFPA